MKLSVEKVVGTAILLEVDVTVSDKLVKSDTLIMPEEFQKTNEERVAYTLETGKVVQLGDLAFVKFYDTLPCRVGDTIMIVPNTGYVFKDSNKNKWFRIVKDVDVIAVLK